MPRTPTASAATTPTTAGTRTLVRIRRSDHHLVMKDGWAAGVDVTLAMGVAPRDRVTAVAGGLRHLTHRQHLGRVKSCACKALRQTRVAWAMSHVVAVRARWPPLVLFSRSQTPTVIEPPGTGNGDVP